MPSEHKFLVSGVLTGMDKEPDYQFILERTVKIVDSTHPDDEFLNHEDSKKLLDTVLNMITSPQSMTVATAVAAAPTLGSASILLPLAGIVAASSSSSSSQLSYDSPIIPPYTRISPFLPSFHGNGQNFAGGIRDKSWFLHI